MAEALNEELQAGAINNVANANFRTAKVCTLRNFTTWEIPGKNLLPFPALEPLQQHKTKNYEKISF